MATLVMGAAGSWVGSFFGPLGSAIGWSIGSALGTLLDPPKTEGPKLTDLKLQTSQYGQPIPIIYGRARIAGNVIWATDMHEHETTSSGKGGPVVIETTYTASFAVLVCEGPIVAISRVWADGRLVQDNTTYDNQLSFIFDTYLGTEDQLPDSTMESFLGVGEVSAHRGLAYVVFDELELTEFGNRLPLLEFEVMTVAQEATQLRIVREVRQDHEWNWSHFGGSGGIGEPNIMQWPDIAGDDFIKVKNMHAPISATFAGGAGVVKYDPETLEFVDTDAYPGPNTRNPDIYVPGISGPDHFKHASIGIVLFNGAPTHVYWSIFGYPTNDVVPRQNPALSNHILWSDDGVNVWTAQELAASFGIPGGVDIYGVFFTQDKTAMFVFTGPIGVGNFPDAWYMIEDAAIADQGTVQGPNGGIADSGGSMAMGNGGSDLVGGNSGMAENNREWFWCFRSGGFGNTAVVSRIDPVTKVFSWFSPGFRTPRVDSTNTFNHTSVMVISDGYCGVVTGDMLAVLSRFPIYDPIGMPLSEIVGDICQRVGLVESEIDVTSITDDIVPGFIIGTRGTARAALAQLQAAFLFDAVESEGKLKFVKRGTVDPVTVDSDHLAATDDADQRPALRETVRTKEEELPASINLTHFDPDTDYQPGTQRAVRDVTLSEKQDTIELSVVMTADQARTAAAQLIFDAWVARERFSAFLPREYAHYEPTDLLTVEGRTMRVVEKVEEPVGVIRFDGVPDGGRMWSVRAPGVAALGHSSVRGGGGAAFARYTEAMLMDLPLLYDSDNELGFHAAVAPVAAGSWIGAELMRSRDDGVTYNGIGTHTVRDTIGYTTDALADFGGGNMFDENSVLNVQLLDGSGENIDSKTELQVINGLNLAVVGAEVIQFKNAVALGDKTYRLTGLLRGRNGTEWAMATHEARERFVVMPVRDYALGFGDLRRGLYYKAVTFGQQVTEAVQLPFTGNGVRLKPLAPVHLGGYANADGATQLSWTRRTRLAAPWRNYVDAPLGETDERYVVEIWNSAYTQVARVSGILMTPAYEYSAAMQIADFGVIQSRVYFAVVQLGSIGPGYAARGNVRGRGASSGNPLVAKPPYAGPPTTIPSPVGSSIDERHMANFTSLMQSDRQLAYKYATWGLVQASTNWYQRHQFEIIDTFFHGDTTSWANWVQDADIHRMVLTNAEIDMLNNLAHAAVYGT